MFCIHGKLFLALKKVWIVKITPQVPFAGKKCPPPPPPPLRLAPPPPPPPPIKISDSPHPLPLYGKPCFWRKFFPIDWHTIDLLFYWEHFYGFSEGDLWKCWKKYSFYNKHIFIYGSHFKVLGNFHFVHIL